MKHCFHLTFHARQRMAERGIYYQDIGFAVSCGDVVLSGEDRVYVLRNMRRFRGEEIPSRLIMLVQKRRRLAVVVAPDKMVKTVFWRSHDKKSRFSKCANRKK